MDGGVSAMQKKKKNEVIGFYELDVDMEKISDRLTLSEVFWLKELQNRQLFFSGEIDQFGIPEIVQHIMHFNAEDAGIAPENRKPIRLYLTSNGGEVDSGFELIDCIRASCTPVWTINLGYLYSMGALIGMAGHKRFATQNAKYLIHDGTNFVYNSGYKAQDQMKFNAKVEGRIKDYILLTSKITPEEYDEKARFEWYMFADEALEKGLVDEVVWPGELEMIL